MRTFRILAVMGATAALVSAAQAQTVLRGMADNRSGSISAFANAPSGDPRENGFNVNPGENDFEPFHFDLLETDVREGCSATRATARLSHDSDFILADLQQRCRGFRAAQSALASVVVTACGVGETSRASFEGNLNVVVRIENAPANGAPIRVRGTASASGGAAAQVRILRPNGTTLLNLTNGAVNAVVNLPNGEYTLMASSSNGSVSRSNIGTSTRAVDYSLGFWKECAGDLDGDGSVTLTDLSVLLSAFGASNQGDLDGDGVTDISDLALLLAHFGSTCNN